MFFRRQRPREYTFAERLEMLNSEGFTVQPAAGGWHVAIRDGCAGVLEEAAGGKPHIARAGYIIGQEICELVDLGYQKIWEAASGRREPTRAEELHALHRFLEDLREVLGLTSLYNESLGTVNDDHRYDRVVGRDGG